MATRDKDADKGEIQINEDNRHFAIRVNGGDKQTDTAFIYGIHARDDDRIVYVGVSVESPRQRLVLFKSPSAVEKGQPNRLTSAWLLKHFEDAEAKTLEILYNKTGTERRDAQLDWIRRLANEGHPLLNREVAGRAPGRRTREERTKQRMIAQIARGSKLNPQTKMITHETLKNVLGPGETIDSTLISKFRAHLQWHVQRNIYNPECVICPHEPKSWRNRIIAMSSQSTENSKNENESNDKRITIRTRSSSVQQSNTDSDVEFVGFVSGKDALDKLDNGHVVNDLRGLEPSFLRVIAQERRNARERVDDDEFVHETEKETPVSQSAETEFDSDFLSQVAQALKPLLEKQSAETSEKENQLRAILKEVRTNLEFLLSYIDLELGESTEGNTDKSE